MKYYSCKQKGFTIVEILVVIGIIATVAAISIPIGLRVHSNSQKQEAAAMMKKFNLAVKNFKIDHDSLFYGTDIGNDYAWSGHQDGTNRAATNGTTLWRYLVALGGFSYPDIYTKTEKDYLVGIKDAQDMDGEPRSGLWRNTTDDNSPTAIFDPWGNYYYIHFDTDGDGEITVDNSAGGLHGGKVAKLGNDHVFMLCLGPDGTADLAADTDKDDIQSHPYK